MLMRMFGLVVNVSVILVVRYSRGRCLQSELSHRGENVGLAHGVEFVFDANYAFDGYNRIHNARDRAYATRQRGGAARVTNAFDTRHDVAVPTSNSSTGGLSLRPQQASRHRPGRDVEAYLGPAFGCVAALDEMNRLNAIDLVQRRYQVGDTLIMAVMRIWQDNIEINLQRAHGFSPISGTVPAERYAAPAIASS